MARTLLIIPIFHGRAELGSIREGMERVTARALGKLGFETYVRNVEKFWSNIERLTERRLESQAMSRVKIYQDGQVINGPVGIKMVAEIAERGSLNHRLVSNLIKKGAKLMRTESFELLKEEYSLIRKIMLGRSAEEVMLAKRAYKARKDSILKARDRYIARNVDRSLKDNELGILFIGAMHRVEDELPPDIEVERFEDKETYLLKKELLKMITQVKF